MVDGIGSTTGSIKNLPVYQQYYQLYLEYNKERGTNISFDAWLQRTNYRQHFLQQVENYIETGNVNGGDGIKGNTLNSTKYLNNGNTSLYQSQDEETYYDFDFDSGTYTVYHGNKSILGLLGLDESQDVDTISFDYKTAEITNYTFGNLDDGQHSSSYNLGGGRFGNVKYTQKEFDIDYIMNALLMNPNDPQYQIASSIFNELVTNMHQWCPQSDLEELDAVAAEHGTNSTEYKEALKDVILKNLDQANEWIDDHDHVEFKNDVTVDLGSNNSDVENNNTGTNTDTNNQNASPVYHKDILIENIGINREYYENDGVWYSQKRYKNGKEVEYAKDHAITHAQELMNKIINELKSQIGTNWTLEMDKYVIDIKNSLLYDTSYVTYHKEEDFWKDDWAHGIVYTRKLTDEFLKRFDEKCANGGKSNEEINKEKEAKKTDYKSLYDMDLNSIASDNQIKDVTVIPTSSNQYAEIQVKAENSIITPLKAQIKAKLASKNIPDKELEELLSQAGTAALANPSNWVTTDNNYSYTIDADKLIDTYEEYIKQGIKSMGYNFESS